MESLARLIPFVLRQRRALVVSVFLSIGTAVFAVAQLSLVYPAMKLMLEGQTYDEHIVAELARAQKQVTEGTNRVEELETRLSKKVWLSSPTEMNERQLQRELRKTRSELRTAQWDVTQFSWLQRRIIPLLPTDAFNFLAFILGLLLTLTLLKETCAYFQEMCVGGVVQRVMQSIRQQLFRTTLRLDQQTLALETTPKLMSRFTFDLYQVAHGMVLLGGKIVVEPIKATLCIAYAFSANWRLTLLAFICAPALALLFGGLGKKLKKAAQRQMESMSRLFRVLDETFSSFRIVQSYRNEGLHRRRLAKEHTVYYEKALRILKIDALVSPSVEFLAMCAVFIGSLPGAYLVLRQKTSIWGIQLAAEEMTVSDLALLYTCMAGVLDPGRKLSGVYSKLKKSATACTRVFAWMDRASLVKTARPALPLPRHSKSIDFEDVVFHYAQLDTDEPGRKALDCVTLTVPFGATVAVVGENGCGKSTLVNLLPRFCDPHSGRVCIDGMDLKSVDLSQLRAQIGVVTQETLLFDWSIADNIRYGKPDVTDAELKAAADQAHVTDFVSRLPEGLQTQIGDKGHRLSGGQRQRVALARAIVRDPAILILDEATSAIDTQSEQCIHNTLRDFTKNRTTFIVTHGMTPSLLQFVTHVLVMDGGQAIAFGAHDSLLKTCPLYQRLFNAQTLKRAG
ncbi:ABC transporter ATP-binding protein [Schlesneria sp. T3-172]|uniref:ABC transporter ATP-binding protein n=1 Tax=Schlesneria sphaerica TaxID=3373610 RepID=UPI0037CB81FC